MASLKDLKEDLAQARDAGDPLQTANLAFKLGEGYRERGKLEQALPLLEEAQAICREHANADGDAMVSLSLAELHLARGEASEAAEQAAAALPHYRHQDDPPRRVRGCLLLGDAHWAREEHAKALPLYEEALELCRTHEDTMGTATLLDRGAKMMRHLGRDGDALPLFLEALGCWEKLGVPDRTAMTWVNLGDIHAKLGHLAEAIQCHKSALSLYRTLHEDRAVSAIEKALEKLRERTG